MGQLGVAAVSVDLTFGAQGKAAPREEEAVLSRLLELFDLYEIAATWGVAEPADSPAAPRIAAAEAAHEIALLGDYSWVGAEAGRSRFARELGRRVGQARDAGHSITSLLLRGARVPREHYDLLVKHSLVLVRQTRLGRGRAIAHLQPRPLRHGVWETPPTVEMPRWGTLFGKGAAAARSAVRRSIAASGLMHLVLDAGALASEDPRFQAVENVLRCIARCCGGGALRTATLGQLAGEWMRPSPSVPARSILRAA